MNNWKPHVKIAIKTFETHGQHEWKKERENATTNMHVSSVSSAQWRFERHILEGNDCASAESCVQRVEPTKFREQNTIEPRPKRTKHGRCSDELYERGNATYVSTDWATNEWRTRSKRRQHTNIECQVGSTTQYTQSKRMKSKQHVQGINSANDQFEMKINEINDFFLTFTWIKS